MSEYQYYEFLAVDRPLSSAQIAEVGEFSTRATITPTSFINQYNFGGGFRGNPDVFLTKYFDAMVYITNWGTHQFMFSVPRGLIDIKDVEPYCTDRMLNVTPSGGRYIFDICRDEEEGGDWEEGSGYMASLVGIRGEVMAGDRRALFLAWLADLEAERVEPDEPVPPIPSGLRKLTAPQRALVDFIGVDTQLVRLVALQSSDSGASVAFDIDAALARTPMADKDAWLKQLVEQDDPHAGLRIKLKLQANGSLPQTAVEATSTETAGALLDRYKNYTRQLDDRLRAQQKIKRERNDKIAAAARQLHLDRVAANIPGAWRNVDQMIGLKNQEGYRQAIEVMIDLRDVSNRPGGNATSFKTELQRRLIDHERKRTFVEMMRKAGLMG